MPIYAYKCATCQHAQDVLQKISAAPLTVCPACGAATYAKQLTAAGFQLKGSGWYVTDFRDGAAKADAKAAAKGGAADATDTPAAASPGAAGATAGSAANTAAGSSGTSVAAGTGGGAAASTAAAPGSVAGGAPAGKTSAS